MKLRRVRLLKRKKKERTPLKFLILIYLYELNFTECLHYYCHMRVLIEHLIKSELIKIKSINILKMTDNQSK